MPSGLHIGNFPDNYLGHTRWSFPTIHSICISYIHMDSSFPLIYVGLFLLSILYIYMCPRLYVCVRSFSPLVIVRVLRVFLSVCFLLRSCSQ